MSEIITSTEQEILIAHMVDRLPALRKKYGISQTELGEKIGLSRQTISAIERKTTPLTWTTMLAILMFFTANSNCVFYFSQQMEVSSTQQVVPNSLKHKWLTTKRTKGGEIISRKPTQKIELKEFSFHEVIYWFLRQRTYSDIKSPSIKLPKEDEGDAVMYILEKLDDDLKFLTQLGVECQMSISPTGSLVLKENEPSAKTHPRFELSFGSQDNEILFSFNECCYKYHPGLFKDAYLEFLSKEGADH